MLDLRAVRERFVVVVAGTVGGSDALVLVQSSAGRTVAALNTEVRVVSLLPWRPALSALPTPAPEVRQTSATRDT